MKVVRFSENNLPINQEPISIILGYFDGVHLGHQKLIKYAKKNAHFKTVLMTFSIPVSSLIEQGKNCQLLTSLDDRFRIVNKYGIDEFYVFEINRDFLKKSPTDFGYFLKKLNVIEVFCGTDFRYGKNRTGSPEILSKSFDVYPVDLLFENGEKISAQKIKQDLLNGDIRKANHLLGHNYLITGTVVHGLGIGQKIGFPTLNIRLSDDYVIPRYGVYQTIAYINGIPTRSISNVGVNPTIDDSNRISIEVHLEHYQKDLDPETIQLEFIDFIRPEQKFDSVEELAAQIALDTKKVFK